MAGKVKGYFSTNQSRKGRTWGLSLRLKRQLPLQTLLSSCAGLCVVSQTKPTDATAPAIIEKPANSFKEQFARDGSSSLDRTGSLFGQSNMQERVRQQEQLYHFCAAGLHNQLTKVSNTSFAFCCLLRKHVTPQTKRGICFASPHWSPIIVFFFPLGYIPVTILGIKWISKQKKKLTKKLKEVAWGCLLSVLCPQICGRCCVLKTKKNYLEKVKRG